MTDTPHSIPPERLAAEFDPAQPFDPALFIQLREHLGYGEFAVFWNGKEGWLTERSERRGDFSAVEAWLD